MHLNIEVKMVGHVKEKQAIGQYIRYNDEIILNEIKEKLSKMYHKSVSISTTSRYLHEYGYKNVLSHVNIG